VCVQATEQRGVVATNNTCILSNKLTTTNHC